MTFPFSEYYVRQTNQQMARRMDRKVIKLEAAFGSERQSIVVKRHQDLVVTDVMEEVQRTLKIPISEQVIFHKGTNLCDFPNETLENLGVENNHTIRVTRDPELPNRSPRSSMMVKMPTSGRQTSPVMMPVQGQGMMNTAPMNDSMSPRYNGYQSGRGLDPVSYLREVAPPNQMQGYNPNLNNQNDNRPNDVIKLYVSYGSEKEYILVHGKKPLTIYDLKRELSRLFKVSPEQQCIVFKGYNLHEFLDEAPLEAFGMENNSPISFWPRSANSNNDVRLPARGPTPPPAQLADAFVSPRLPPLGNRWDSTMSNGADQIPHGEVLKIEVQHGSDRHSIILKGRPHPTVLNLQTELERITSVPVPDQKLFFKSQQLEQTPYKTLKECEVENNHVIKLIGEPSKMRYSNYFGRIVIPNPNDPNQRAFGAPQQNGYQPNNFSQNY